MGCGFSNGNFMHQQLSMGKLSLLLESLQFPWNWKLEFKVHDFHRDQNCTQCTSNEKTISLSSCKSFYCGLFLPLYQCCCLKILTPLLAKYANHSPFLPPELCPCQSYNCLLNIQRFDTKITLSWSLLHLLPLFKIHDSIVPLVSFHLQVVFHDVYSMWIF